MAVHLLIVEDDDALRKQIRAYLSSSVPVIDIAEAADGWEAFTEINRRHPDIILMDIKLPGENGLKLTAKIKENLPQVVIVINTNYDSPEYWESAYSVGADYFLSKTKNTIRDLVFLTEKLCAQIRNDSD